MPLLDIQPFTEELKASDGDIQADWETAFPIEVDVINYQSFGANNAVDISTYDRSEFRKYKVPNPANYFWYYRASDCDHSVENCVDTAGYEQIGSSPLTNGSQLSRFDVPVDTYWEKLGINTLRPAASIHAVTSDSFDWNHGLTIYVGDGEEPIIKIEGNVITTYVDVTVSTGPTCIDSISTSTSYSYIDGTIPSFSQPPPKGGNLVLS